MKSVQVPENAKQLQASRDGIFVMSWDGTIYRLEGSGWSALAPSNSWGAGRMWASGPAEFWRSGMMWVNGGHDRWQVPWLEHWNGNAWVRSDVAGDVSGFWGLSPTAIWMATEAGVSYWDGAAWSRLSEDAATQVWATSPDDVWATAAYGGTIDHWDGVTWTKRNASSTRIFGTRGGHVWFVGTQGVIARSRD